jgi:hypothetical protein
MTNETAPPPDPAGPKGPALAIPFTNGQLTRSATGAPASTATDRGCVKTRLDVRQ